ncbi:Cytochrome P450 [Popillia japonica]|uniref:Cytochrome P450 n=1 Tax=Popillia japonica TaxID=7064 RepID=A0AAW1IY99_POPJA
MLGLIFIILILLCLLICVRIVEKSGTNYWRDRNVVFKKPLLFFGNIIDVILLRKSFNSVVKELYFELCAPYFGIWYLGDPQLVIKSPDLIKDILVKDFDYFQNRHVSHIEDIDKFTARMLAFMDGSRWKQKRATVTPVFSSNKLKCCHVHIREIAKTMICHINTTKLNVQMDLKKLCKEYTIGALSVIIFGLNISCFNTQSPILKINPCLSLLDSIQFTLYFSKSYLLKVFIPKYIKCSAKQIMIEFVSDILNKKRKLLSNNIGFNVLNSLIDDEDNNLDDVISRLSEFFIASYHSTSSSISLALYELALNKNIQSKLRQEINENFDKYDDISYNELIFMEYLDKIIHETLRKYPIMSIIGRTCVRSYKMPNCALTIEEGVRVLIPLSALHHDPKYFPEPNLFDPERFSKENIRERPAYCYLPFGAGPRQCLGEKMALLIMKLAVVYIIRNYEIDVCEDTNIKVEASLMDFVLDVNGNTSIRFKAIDSSTREATPHQ